MFYRVVVQIKLIYVKIFKLNLVWIKFIICVIDVVVEDYYIWFYFLVVVYNLMRSFIDYKDVNGQY